MEFFLLYIFLVVSPFHYSLLVTIPVCGVLQCSVHYYTVYCSVQNSSLYCSVKKLYTILFCTKLYPVLFCRELYTILFLENCSMSCSLQKGCHCTVRSATPRRVSCGCWGQSQEEHMERWWGWGRLLIED